MTTSLTFSWLERLNPLRLAGPLLDRELRVSSRRRRTYVLRIGYVAIMCLFALAAWCWIMARPSRATTVFGASRFADVGRQVVQNVLWFQFMAAQLVAAAMLSSSMVDEMHRGGLRILLTTPITSVQIVLGKLLSRMWQIILLLAISLPALAVVRVMGGISWDSVTSSFCITLTASLFVGALCLWLSTYCRYPHQVISSAAVIYLVVFIALPALAMVVASVAGLDRSLLYSIILLVSPRLSLNESAYPGWYSSWVGPGYFHSWPVHCLIMLGLTMALLGHCARRVRRASVQAFGLAGARTRRKAWLGRWPIVWRELVGNLSGCKWESLLLVIGAACVCALIAVGRILLGRNNPLLWHARDIAWVFWMIALLHLAVLAAGAIAREKEGGTLPLLLTTPLGERWIVRGKLLAVASLAVPWVLAALVVQTCYVACAIRWEERWGAVCYVVTVLASSFFVMTAGIYFGARLKTTAAIVVTVGAHLLLRHLVFGYYNPLYVWLQQWLQQRIMTGLGRGNNTVVLFYHATSLVVAVLEVGLGLFLLRRTETSLRRYV